MPELSILREFRHSYAMNGERESLIERIQGSGHKAAITVSGGGIGAIYAVLSHSGASRFVLESQIPYSAPAMFHYLGEQLESFCSEEAARIMAERAFERALIFTLPQGDESPILGISCTAALQTNRARKGTDRAFMCIKSRDREEVRHLEMEAATRREQEETVSEALLDFIADFLGVSA